MSCRCVEFAAPRRARVVEEPLPQPGAGEVLVATRLSAISTGTEILVYRGEFPIDHPLDETLGSLSGSFAWPVRYGYAAVGEVAEVGPGAPESLRGRRVFAFQPHRSHFVATPGELIPLPEHLDPEAAALLPSVETALSLVMDGRPLLGERVLVVGQGVVGLLTTALLARIPLEALVAVDRLPGRREAARELGASAALGPEDAEGLERALTAEGADLAYELSGNPAALDLALHSTGREGRVVVGSWYGNKRVEVDLGTHFHRGRLRLRSSQVSHLDPALGGRWTKARRLAFALRLLEELEPARLITHRFPVEEAAAAYRLLDEAQERALQVLFTY